MGPASRREDLVQGPASEGAEGLQPGIARLYAATLMEAPQALGRGARHLAAAALPPCISRADVVRILARSRDALGDWREVRRG